MLAGSIFLSLVAIVAGVTYFLVFACALIHCLQNKHDKDRLLWVLLIVFVPFGGALYFAIGRPSAVEKQRPGSHVALFPVPERAPPPTANPPFDVGDMHDERMRAASINASLSQIGAGNVRRRHSP